MTGALLVLPGWDDKGRHQYEALRADLDGWYCRRANLPDCDWPHALRSAVNREQTLQQAVRDHDTLCMESDRQRTNIAVLGFSYGGYMAALLSKERHVDWLVLRSPALYPDEDWHTAKEDLDKRALDDYRHQVHAPASNRALRCCTTFSGHVLLIDSERDRTIPPQVIQSYAQAFSNARSVSRYTLAGADHALSDPNWQLAYHEQVAHWLRDMVANNSRNTAYKPEGATITVPDHSEPHAEEKPAPSSPPERRAPGAPSSAYEYENGDRGDHAHQHEEQMREALSGPSRDDVAERKPSADQQAPSE